MYNITGSVPQDLTKNIIQLLRTMYIVYYVYFIIDTFFSDDSKQKSVCIRHLYFKVYPLYSGITQAR